MVDIDVSIQSSRQLHKDNQFFLVPDLIKNSKSIEERIFEISAKKLVAFSI